MLRVFREAETGEDAGSAGRRAVRIDRIQPLVDLGDAVPILGVLGFGQKLGALGRRRKHGLKRRRLPARRFLSEVADARPRRHLDPAVVGFMLPGDQLQQRRLAGAVPPDQPDMRPGRERGCRLVENEISAKAERETVKNEHERTSGSAPHATSGTATQDDFHFFPLRKLSKTRVNIGTPDLTTCLTTVSPKLSLRAPPPLAFLASFCSAAALPCSAVLFCKISEADSRSTVSSYTPATGLARITALS